MNVTPYGKSWREVGSVEPRSGPLAPVPARVLICIWRTAGRRAGSSSSARYIPRGRARRTGWRRRRSEKGRHGSARVMRQPAAGGNPHRNPQHEKEYCLDCPSSHDHRAIVVSSMAPFCASCHIAVESIVGAPGRRCWIFRRASRQWVAQRICTVRRAGASGARHPAAGGHGRQILQSSTCVTVQDATIRASGIILLGPRGLEASK